MEIRNMLVQFIFSTKIHHITWPPPVNNSKSIPLPKSSSIIFNLILLHENSPKTTDSSPKS
jgi:hypothetical protein